MEDMGDLMKYVFTLLLILVCITPTLSPAADNSDIHENAGTRAMTFLKIGIGAKAIGMGESHVAAADDLYASYWNPAGLVKLQKPQLALMHNERFADINYEHIGVAFPIGEKNSVGASVNYQSYGEMQGRDQEGNETELFNAYDLAMVLSYARGFGDSLAVGVNAKLLREQIADENGSGFAFDFGGMYTMPDLPLSFGINAQHIGPRIKYVEEAFLLPFTLRIGAAYRLWNESFLVTMDFIRPTDNHNSFGVGLGYT
ncbi:PorV/PorQ family protein, partial [Candidatus Poribacteria bacterium]|nr:PorV/PorQ family protein [Candidatus Poribacteria bacterium]